ncbi:MAG TPA: molybdopterin cofactor-binding domain-containing protein [Candidatus Acidoferrales bacterium]|jgi:nicotinate dehydrogenase subunit B|nr:molybdopterin cofactor-binding domain-containing protein [Candidatus Acidoferrales bacterium]
MSRAEETFLLEPERYEFRAMPMHQFALGRRDFFKIFGAGLAVFAVAKSVAATQETAPGPHGYHNEELPKEIGAWLHIGEDGTITGFAGKAEIGQNVRTSLAQTIADELGVAFASVRMVLADTALTPFDAGTFGSRTIATITPQLRKVAAAARDLLVEKAAKQWNVPADKLVAGNGKVSDPASGESFRYAELAREDLDAQKPPAKDPIKPASQWTVAGEPIPKVDAREFVTGGHRYTTDLRPEGMLYGKLLRPPSFGATLISYDDSAAKALKDVVLVHDGDFVGAAAPTVAAGEAVLAALRVQWKEVPQISGQEIFSYLKRNAQPSKEARFRQAKGSVEEGLAAAAHKLDASYSVAYIAHAPLEPRAAVAQWTDGKLTVWMGTQRPFAVRDDLADIFHVPEKNVRVIVPDTGSAYGGKHTSDAGLEAARLARATGGRPVKLVWTREEEFTWAYFRPAGVIDVKGGIAADGKLTAWEFHNYHSGMSGIDTPYVVTNQVTEYHQVPLVLRSGSYRGLAATANHFARETHMDSLAHAASMDPLEFRLKNLADPRMRAVLETGAKAFGWPRRKAEEGQGFGVAAGYEKGSYVATFAEIFVDRKKKSVTVKKLVEVFECGAIVNPDGLRNQVVGAMIQGLGGALFESIQFENGRISNAHFSSYRVPRFRDVPEIEAILLDRKDIPSAGAGETPIMAIAPAIGNAFHDATKVRLTKLPLQPELHLLG